MAIRLVPVPYKRDGTIERKSLADLRKRLNKLIDFGSGVIEMRGDPKAITARRGDDVPRIELVI